MWPGIFWNVRCRSGKKVHLYILKFVMKNVLKAFLQLCYSTTFVIHQIRIELRPVWIGFLDLIPGDSVTVGHYME